ncbi:MAG: type II toxin-antitoxin system YoeB family toxin [Erysipelotrichales bacterium]|nr:type II toxin-antitoxin system YoeB family toxin [Erysipelotrichales bacterium]
MMKGIGKPEALREIKSYSRRIDIEHRLVYMSDANHNLVILHAKAIMKNNKPVV